MFLTKLVKALDRAKIEYAIAGGFAVALHGAVRGTVDIDLVVKITLESLEDVSIALQSLGLQSRIPVSAQELFMFRLEYIKKRNLVAWSFSNPNNPIEMVDIIITHDLSNMHSCKKNVDGVAVKVIALQDLIEMKRVSGRPQDLEDIKALEKL